MSDALTRQIAAIPNRVVFSPLFLVGLLLAGPVRLALPLWWSIVRGRVRADVRRRWGSEPTEQSALGLFLIALPVGLALILIGIGRGFGL